MGPFISLGISSLVHNMMSRSPDPPSLDLVIVNAELRGVCALGHLGRFHVCELPVGKTVQS